MSINRFLSWLLLAFYLALPLQLIGFDHQINGPKAMAMGGIAMHERNHWAGFQNPAGLALQTASNLGVAFLQRYMISALSTGAIAFGSPISNGGFGIAMHHYGFEKYRSTRAAVGYGITISERVALGAQLNAFDARFGDDYPRHFSIVPAVGVIFSPDQDWEIACRYFNPLRVKRSKDLKEEVTSALGISAKRTYSSQLSFAAELEKGMNHPFVVALGVSYTPGQHTSCLVGFRSRDRSISWGFSYQRSGLEILLANAWSQPLGISTSIGFSHRFASKQRSK
jgi:hypothetical protein